MGSKKYTTIISILFIILLMSTNKQKNEIFPGLVPAPAYIEFVDSKLQIEETIRLDYNPKDKNLNNMIRLAKSELSDIGYKPSDSNSKQEQTRLSIRVDQNISEAPESYRLKIDPQGIEITGSDHAGTFYGIQTLLQILETSKIENAPTVKSMIIEDSPRFKWRGMLLDVARHMFPADFIKRYIDIIAAHKMNVFHWHLTEDQGWRMPIEKYPKLEKIAAWRKETLIGHYTDKPRKFDGKPYGGFYTREEIVDIIGYAEERSVTIVPEIELPGHATAALSAYPELSCTGGPHEAETLWGVHKEVYCAGNEETFVFLENVLKEVSEIFPGPYIHIGGDECPKTRWKECQKCQKRIADEGLKDEHELQSYFIKRIEKILEKFGKRLIGWDEILEGGLAPNAVVHSWRGMDGGIEAANAGHEVIMSPTTHVYFDYYQSEDKDNEPLAIGGHLPLEKVYEFEPVPDNIDRDKRHLILGGQANLWTEYIPTTEKAEYMLLPRMCALAEAVWSPRSKKDYAGFIDRLGDHLKRLDRKNLNYRKLDK